MINEKGDKNWSDKITELIPLSQNVGIEPTTFWVFKSNALTDVVVFGIRPNAIKLGDKKLKWYVFN